MPRVIHFEIHADDTARAVAFYQRVFGWRIERTPMPVEYWLCHTGEGPGIDGAITPRAGGGQTWNTIDVPSLDDFIAEVKAAGGALVSGPHEIPGVGRHAYVKDTEGNVFSIMQEAPRAGQRPATGAAQKTE